MLPEMAGVQAEAAVIRAARADKAVLRHGRSGDAGDAGPAGMHALGPGAVFEKFEASAGHRQHDALRHRSAFGIEAEKPRRGERAAERADQPGGMKTHLMKAAFRDCSEPGRDFHRRDKGGQQRLAVRAVAIGESERAGKAARGCVNDAPRMRVVKVEAVNEDAVHHHRIAQRETPAEADHRRGTRAELFKRGERDRREGIFGRGERDADRVEDEIFGAFANGRRYGVVTQAQCEPRELFGNGGLRRRRFIGQCVHWTSPRSFAVQCLVARRRPECFGTWSASAL